MGAHRVPQWINRTEHAEDVEAGTGGLRGDLFGGKRSGSVNE
jgi:hypothetical protein